MSARKVCATRKTKANPNVYLVSELRKLASDAGHSSDKVKKLNKQDLCKLLGIDWVGKSTKKTVAKPKATSSQLVEVDAWEGRPCNVNRSLKYPSAFDKAELVELAVQHLKIEEKKAKTYTKTQLCGLLSGTKEHAPSGKHCSENNKGEYCGCVENGKGKRHHFTSEEVAEKDCKGKKYTKKFKTSPKKSSKTKPKTAATKPKPKVSKPSPKISPEPSPKGDCISRSKLPLHKHQRDIVEYLQTHRGVIAAFEVGTGKTLTAVAASQCFLDDNPKGQVIVVTPTSLQANFKKELVAYGGKANDKRYEVTTITKFAKKYAKERFPDNAMLIIDEAHELRTDIPSALNNAARRYRIGVEKYRNGIGEKPDVPIVRADVAVRSAALAEKVLLLTATPLYNSPSDLLNLVAMVKGDMKPMTQRKFEAMSPKDMCEYFRGTIMFHRNPRSSDYPEFKEHYINVVMNQAYYRKYRNVEEQNHHMWSDTNPWVFLTGVRQATNALDPCQKCEWAVRKIEEGEKTLVYSAFLTHGVKKLQKMLNEKNIPFVEVTGSMKASDREIAVKEYNTDKVKVFFITKAGGQGLDLKGTRNVILLEKAWNRPNEDQVIGRAIRYKSHSHLPKSQRHVDIYHLVLIKPAPELREDKDKRGSADEILLQVIEEKEMNNAVFLKLLESVSIDAPKNTKCPPARTPLKKKLLSPKRDELTFFEDEQEDQTLVDVVIEPFMYVISNIPALKKVILSHHKNADIVVKKGDIYVNQIPKSTAEAVIKDAIVKVLGPKIIEDVDFNWDSDTLLNVVV